MEKSAGSQESCKPEINPKSNDTGRAKRNPKKKNPENQEADRRKKSLGKRGEDAAARYLEACGHVIIARNFRCRSGELDIVARDFSDGSLVFIEVKTRRSISFGLPCEAVTPEKRAHLRRAAETYMAYTGCIDELCRMDVIELIVKKDKFYLRHLKNCF